MRRIFSGGILTAAALVAAVIHTQAQSNVYAVGIHSGGTTYWQYFSSDSPVPPKHLKFSGRWWYEDGHGLHIINTGHEIEMGGILHRSLDIECGSESFTVLLEPGPTNLQAVAAHSVLAVVMETGFPGRPTTLIATVDGSAGLYSTNQGKLAREDENQNLKSAAERLVAKAGELKSTCAMVKEFPLPEKAHTRFYIITSYEVYEADAQDHALLAPKHQMHPIFQAAHELITQIEQTQQSRRARPATAPPAP